MTSEQEALLAGVAANPDDDLPRLVYADWLEEHARSEADTARAHFIRQQIAEWRDPTPWELSKAPRPSLAVLREHHADWLAFLTRKQRAWVKFERGFPQTLRSVTGRTAFFSRLGDPRGGLATVTRLVFADQVAGSAGRPDFARLATSPGLTRLRELSIHTPGTSGRDVARVLANPGLARLGALDVTLSGDAPALLAAEPPAPLRRLSVSRGVADRGGLEAAHVERSPLLRGVTDLALRGGGLHPFAAGGMEAVGRRANLPAVERLVLSGGSDQFARFLVTMDLPTLRHLALFYFGAGAAADALAANPHGCPLEGLTLDNAPSSLADIVRLIECPALAGLKRLDVDHLDDPGPVYEYLLAADAPLRFEKLCVGRGRWVNSPYADRLRARYGAAIQCHTDVELAPALRRLGRW